LCYLDFGMMSYAASNQRNGFLLAVVHIVNRDWSELAKLYVRLGFIPEGTDLRPIEIALEDALPDILNADISKLNFKNVINELGDIMYESIDAASSLLDNCSNTHLPHHQVQIPFLSSSLLYRNNKMSRGP
jgi:predicted unusual protein kinase regulating ubiquinone biosynthesis (AarF/ABC1/UbiB family)